MAWFEIDWSGPLTDAPPARYVWADGTVTVHGVSVDSFVPWRDLPGWMPVVESFPGGTVVGDVSLPVRASRPPIGKARDLDGRRAFP